MTRSSFVERLDKIQAALTSSLKPTGFRRLGRTFNRSYEPGIVQVINLWMAQFPIGARQPQSPLLEQMRPNLYGKFTVELGVHIREVWDSEHPKALPKALRAQHCQIRTRLGWLSERADLWWSLDAPTQAVSDDLEKRLDDIGLPFLDQFATRDNIIRDWVSFNEREKRLSARAKVDVAIILTHLGKTHSAVQLLEEHLRYPAQNPGHVGYVRRLAQKLGLGELSP